MAISLAAALRAAIRAAGVPIDEVSIGENNNKATWRVYPPSLQAAAQPTIDGFDYNAQAVQDAGLEQEAAIALDDERLISSVVWVMIDQFAAPATVAKYQNARTKILSAYKARPWRA